MEDFHKKRALITGITGQDGSYLAEFLLEKGYEVHGIIRRSSNFNTQRIEHLTKGERYFEEGGGLLLHYGDLTDSTSIEKIMSEILPDEIYNLGAQSHVRISFEIPENTTEIIAMGTLRILEAMRKFCPTAKFYQASSSEMYGLVTETPQSEDTRFYPRSPYGCAKVYAHHITVNYREAYDLHASNGILFNHESERRGENFVTRKITSTLSRIKVGEENTLFLGNLDAQRDWGHARDYVRAMWLILQQKFPGDYVIGTGEKHSVREFLEESAKELGMQIHSNGEEGVKECYLDEDGKEIVKIDAKYFRPTEVDLLCADYEKATKQLGWEPQIKFKELVRLMCKSDLKIAEKEFYLKSKEEILGGKISSAIKPLLEFAEKYGIDISLK